jgi:hypothetical protein
MRAFESVAGRGKEPLGADSAFEYGLDGVREKKRQRNKTRNQIGDQDGGRDGKTSAVRLGEPGVRTISTTTDSHRHSPSFGPVSHPNLKRTFDQLHPPGLG